MTIWYSISAQFTLRPDADRHALAVAVVAYEEATVPAVRIADDTVTVEAEGDMCRGTADDLRAGLVRLIHDFGDGAAVHITTRSSDDDDESPWHNYAGSKAAVLAALGHLTAPGDVRNAASLGLLVADLLVAHMKQSMVAERQAALALQNNRLQ